MFDIFLKFYLISDFQFVPNFSWKESKQNYLHEIVTSPTLTDSYSDVMVFHIDFLCNINRVLN